MANKSENAEIAVLQDQMGRTNADITEIKGDVKTVLAKFEAYANLQDQLTVLRTEFEQYRKDQKNSNFIKTFGAVLITATISALVYLAFGANR